MPNRDDPGVFLGNIFSHYQKIWETMFSAQNSSIPQFKAFTFPDMSKDFFNTYFSFFKGAKGPEGSSENDVIERLSTGLRFYSGLLSWWWEMYKNQYNSFSHPGGNPFTSFPQGQMKIVETYNSSFMQWVDMFSMYLRDMDNPGSTEMKDRIKRHMDAMLQIYEDGPGKFIKIPSVGPARYTLERSQEWLDSTIKYQMILLEYIQNIIQPILRVSAGILESAKTIIEEDPSEESLKKLYTMLIEEGEKAYNELFKSEAYLHSLKTTLDANLDFNRTYETMMVEMLKGTPIVTKPGIEEVYREIYLLKKKVRLLEKKLSDKGKSK